MKKRILFVEEGIGFGGSIFSLSELLKGMKALADVEAFVLSDQEDEILNRLFPEDVHQIRARRLLTYRHRFAYRSALRKARIPDGMRGLFDRGFSAADLMSDRLFARSVAGKIKELKIDIVHCNNGWNYPSLLAAQRTGVPAVLHYRQLPPENPGPRLQRKLEALEGTIHAGIGISKHISEGMVRFGHRSSMVHTIHNPVDITPFQEAARNRTRVREAYGLVPDDVVFGIFGRVTPWKGQLELLKAVSEPLTRLNNMKIMIVGDASDTNDKGYISRVQDLMNTAPFEGQVILTGYQSAVHDFYAASDVVVHNSTTPEPFGRVVIEGMASGRPVVAMDEGGPVDIITHDVDGLLVEPRNPAPLAHALERLHGDPELRTRLAENGLKTVAKNHNNIVIAERVLNLYP